MTAAWEQLLALLALVPWWAWAMAGFVVNFVKWFFILWVFFLAVMKLKDVEKSGVLATLHPNVQLAARTVLLIGVTINLFVRVCLSWLVFWEIPPPFKHWGEWAVSAQVKRLCNEGSGWRQQRAFFWRDNVLRPFDLWGGHD